MKAFKNAAVYIGGKTVKTSLTFDKRILSVGGECAQAEVLPLPEGAVVVPGFIDVHMHGACGADVMDATESALSVISRAVAGEGTTSFLATTMTQSESAILDALEAVKNFRAKGARDGARLEGVHLEGPFISAAYKGAQPEKYISPPDVELFKKFNAASGNAIKIVTLAPEVKGAGELIRYLSANGITPSVGHTAAKEEDILRAINCGANHVTHTFNAQSPFHHRDIGTAGSALLYDGLACELIADLVHVSANAIRLLYKAKSRSSVILITDAIRAKGLPDGVSELGGQTVYIGGNEARLADGTLAGSVLRMNQAVKNLVEKAGIDFGKAIDSATIEPARAIGADRETGSIETGKRADLAVLSADFEVLYTICGGDIIYRNI